MSATEEADVAAAIVDQEPEAKERHKKILEEVKSAYDAGFREIFDQIKPEHFEPFTQILRAQDGTEFNVTELVDELKPALVDNLNKMLQQFFTLNDVDNKLIALEILKEKYKDSEGTTWNTNDLTPEQHIQQERMRLKDASIRCLKQRLEAQEKELAQAKEVSKSLREQIEEVKSQRTLLRELMKTKATQYDELKPKLLELQQELNEIDDDEI